ncbi:MAG: choice-of-anchor B family protein [Bacteroidetes Order II. Incertae sedis bacterium]|nr:choice-of-anchor B family protein [Bacteroidetes Order II. bacterium]
MYRLILPLLFLLTISPAAAQRFGNAVAVSQNEIIAGDGESQVHPGIVYVFDIDDSGNGVTTQKLSSGLSTDERDGFGQSVAATDDALIVGSSFQQTVTVFNRTTEGDWAQQHVLSGSYEGFGTVVSISEKFAAVSDPGNAERSGTVSVFQRTTTGLEHMQDVSLDSLGVNSAFGASMTFIGNELFVGAPNHSDATGSVFVYQLQEGVWMPHSESTLRTRYIEDGMRTGTALATDGTFLAVGSPGFDRNTGTVFLYSKGENEWTLSGRVASFSSNLGDQFGSSVAFGSGELWVGSPGRGGRRGTGGAFVFEMDGQEITGTRMVTATELPSGATFGSSLAINDHIAAVGSGGYDVRAGAVIPFLLGSTLVQGDPLFDGVDGFESISGGLVECTDNQAAAFPCKDVDMTSFVSMQDLGADRGIRTNDLWGWEDPETGKEYAIVGLTNGTSFVDVTDAYNPIPLGVLPMTETATIAVWRDMKVYKDHAYIVADGAGEHGIQIFDLRQLRTVTSFVTFDETAHYEGIFSAHNIVINEETGFAYSVGSSAGETTCGGGLHMIDIREPANPKFAGCFSDGESGRRGTGYSHDAQCIIYRGPDTDYNGHEICVGSNETAISIADVTDKDAPISVSMATYPSVAYAHQGWFTEDHRYFYLNDEIDEANGWVDGTRTLIWDLIDLDEPELAGEFIAETTETDHNLYVKGDLMYQSNTGAGLRIIDISDPENPFETAYFDTSPVGGRGVSWSNYPYYKSGLIAVTGGHYGLFLVKKKEIDL